MAFKSMTGFGRADGHDEQVSWHWEIRSVNGKGRDFRFRTPPGFEDLEQKARPLCARAITRGNCSLNLQVRRQTGTLNIVLNEHVLTQVIDALDRANTLIGSTSNIQPARLDGILGLRGVLELAEPEDNSEVLADRKSLILNDLEAALEQLIFSRMTEGNRLKTALLEQISRIEGLVKTCKNSPSRTPETIQEKLRQQVDRLITSDNALDDNRLFQEAILLATKADIEEEIERLEAHCEAAKSLLASEKPVGRRLEFLIQEFNREANTLCSKSNNLDLTNAGLEMKTIIDQMREQVQNIE